MYDNSEDLSPSAVYGRKHPLSRRFLDYSFGDGQSLRHDLDEFVRGVSRRDLDRFCAWCGALRLMKTTEQPTEGLHRSLHQIMSRAPNASPAYLSTESRLPMFGRAFNSPETLAWLAQKMKIYALTRTSPKQLPNLLEGPGAYLLKDEKFLIQTWCICFTIVISNTIVENKRLWFCRPAQRRNYEKTST